LRTSFDPLRTPVLRVLSAGVADPTPPPRVRLVIVEGNRVALIRRRRAGHTYYVLPGGGVEPGETFVQAGKREAMEELGVEVACEKLLAEEDTNGERFLYYRARITGGEFGAGTWPDFAALPPAERAARGTYEPVWLDVDDIGGLDIAAPLPALLGLANGLIEIE
jgi:8-oxo-dGTP diphosphatase